MKHPEQRVGVFIDVANMYYSARSSYNAKVNFGKVVDTALAGRRLVRAIAYAVKADMPEEQGFFDALKKMGIEVYTKDLQTFYDGSKKGNVDMELAIDALKLAPKLDVVVVVSGDGDYCILLEHLKAQGCRVEVIGFGKSASSRLRDVADDFINLEDDVSKYLIRSRDSVDRPPRARPVTTPRANSTPSRNNTTAAAKPPVPVRNPPPVNRPLQPAVPAQVAPLSTTAISATSRPIQLTPAVTPPVPAANQPGAPKVFQEHDLRHLATTEQTWKK